MIDLFEDIDSLPQELQDIISEYNELDLDYPDCQEFLDRVEIEGYTFEYDLDAVPCNLRKI